MSRKPKSSAPFVPQPGQPMGQVLDQALKHAVDQQAVNPLAPPVVREAMVQLGRDLESETR